MSGSNGTSGLPLSIQVLTIEQNVAETCLYLFHFKSNQDVCMINKSTDIPVYLFKTHQIDYTRLQRKIVLEIQQTEIEKLADSFRFARFTLADSFKNP